MHEETRLMVIRKAYWKCEVMFKNWTKRCSTLPNEALSVGFCKGFSIKFLGF
jgi:hypothetical protein